MSVLRLEANVLQEALPIVCIRVRLESECLPFWAAVADVNMVAVCGLFALDMERLERLHVGRRLRCVFEVHGLPIRQTILHALEFRPFESGCRGKCQATEQTKNQLASRHGDFLYVRGYQVDGNFLSASAFTGPDVEPS